MKRALYSIMLIGAMLVSMFVPLEAQAATSEIILQHHGNIIRLDGDRKIITKRDGSNLNVYSYPPEAAVSVVASGNEGYYNIQISGDGYKYYSEVGRCNKATYGSYSEMLSVSDAYATNIPELLDIGFKNVLFDTLCIGEPQREKLTVNGYELILDSHTVLVTENGVLTKVYTGDLSIDGYLSTNSLEITSANCYSYSADSGFTLKTNNSDYVPVNSGVCVYTNVQKLFWAIRGAKVLSDFSGYTAPNVSTSLWSEDEIIIRNESVTPTTPYYMVSYGTYGDDIGWYVRYSEFNDMSFTKVESEPDYRCSIKLTRTEWLLDGDVTYVIRYCPNSSNSLYDNYEIYEVDPNSLVVTQSWHNNNEYKLEGGFTKYKSMSHYSINTNNGTYCMFYTGSGSEDRSVDRFYTNSSVLKGYGMHDLTEIPCFVKDSNYRLKPTRSYLYRGERTSGFGLYNGAALEVEGLAKESDISQVYFSKAMRAAIGDSGAYTSEMKAIEDSFFFNRYNVQTENSQGKTDVMVYADALTNVSITVPLTVDVVINPNDLNNKVVCSELYVENETAAPVAVSVKNFKKRKGIFTSFIAPEDLESFVSGDNLLDYGSVDSRKYFAAYVQPKSTDDSWMSKEDTKAFVGHVDNSMKLGALKGKTRSYLDLNIFCGNSFEKAESASFYVTFIVELE